MMEITVEKTGLLIQNEAIFTVNGFWVDDNEG